METKKPYIRPEILVEEWKVYKETYSLRYGRLIYEVSNQGNVKINGELVKFDETAPGYYVIAKCLVHRIVAQLFIPNPENKPEVDHIDTNKHNNAYWNLRWVTHKENCNNPLTRQRQTESAQGRNHSDITKRKMRQTHNSTEIKQKHREAAKDRNWINKNGEQTRIKTNQIDSYLNDGWELGMIKRKINIKTNI